MRTHFVIEAADADLRCEPEDPQKPGRVHLSFKAEQEHTDGIVCELRALADDMEAKRTIWSRIPGPCTTT